MAITISDINSLATREELNELVTALNVQRREVSETKKMVEDLLQLAKRGFRRRQITESEFLSPSEFASLVGRSYATTVRWCMDGTIAGAIQPRGEGTAWFIPRSALQDFRNQSKNSI